MIRKNKYLVAFAVATSLVAVGFFLKKRTNEENPKLSVSIIDEKEKSYTEAVSDFLLVENGTTVQKVQISTGKVEPANLLEQENFNGFEGFPKLGDNKVESVEQSSLLVSRDRSQAIVTVTTYKSSAVKQAVSQVVLDTMDYLCDISQRSCQKSDIFSETYQGIDNELQKKNSALMWFEWDSKKNLLFGHLVLDDIGDVSPVYVCDTQKKICDKTLGFDSMKTADARAVVPAGAFSPTLEKFVMVLQNDKPNIETGGKWELLLYGSSDLSESIRSYDISEMINQASGDGYDGVYSVAWTQDEKKLAIATASRIFMFDFETGKPELVYTDPIIEESDLNLDSSALYLSPDGRYIAFIDFADLQDRETDESVNVLKRIDLENGNEVTELLSDNGLSLKLK